MSGLETVETSVERGRGRLDPMKWIESNRVIRNQPFSYMYADIAMMLGNRDKKPETAPRPYLHAFLRDTCLDVSVIKARQLEATESEINSNLFLACTRPDTFVRHVFPTAGVGNQIAKERIHPAIMNSPNIMRELKKPYSQSSHGFTNGSFYTVASSWTEHGGRGPNSDKITFDEYESQNPKIEEIYGESTSHSSLGKRTRISTPLFPGSGIDARFEDSCGFEWWVVCPKCRKRQMMTFPDSIIGFFDRQRDDDEGAYLTRLKKTYIGCKYCKAYLDRTSPFYLSHAKWFPRRKNLVGLRNGYRLTCFMAPWKTGMEVLYKYHRYRYIHQFWNEVVGFSYRSEDTNIPKSAVEGCSDKTLENRFVRLASVRNVSIGVDWGPTESWVIVMGNNVPSDPKQPTVLYMERIDRKTLQQHGYSGADTDHVKRFLEICGRFRPAIIIDDANGIGNDRNSTVVRRYKSRAWGCFYDTAEVQKQKRKVKTLEPQWQPKMRKVTVSRTGTLKLMLQTFRESRITFPRLDPLTMEFVDHVCNMAVEQMEDPATGAEYEVVGKTGPDHLAHSYNYAKIGFDKLTGVGGVAGVV